MAKSPEDITAKSVEISKCLINKEAGFHTYDLDVTRTTGDVARFAANIRQAGSLSERQLVAISYAMKQDFRSVRSDILPILENLGWIEVRREGGHVARLDESIPPLPDILAALGKRWEEQSPSEVDQAAIASIMLLSRRPSHREALLADLGVSAEAFETTLQYGQQTDFLGTFLSAETGKDVVWTPFYWSGKLDKVQKYLSRQTEPDLEEIGDLAKRLVDYPGRPIEQLKSSTRGILPGGIAHGFFPAVGVKDRSDAEHSYVFAATPHFSAEPGKDIFEKARMIVACIRHGQYHAEVSRIVSPVLLLRALREGRIGPHSYAHIQYALLVENRICDYEEVQVGSSKRYRPMFIDTPENNTAADVAEEMLRGVEPAAGAIEEPQVNELLTRGTFTYSSEQRSIRSASKIVAKEPFNRMMQYLHAGGELR